MYDYFGSIQSLVKLETVNIDNNVFRLHYKVTVVFLVAFSLLVTGKEYFGDPIDCIQSEDEDLQQFIDTYCWIHSTFTLPEAMDKKVGTEVPHPGIDTFTAGEKRTYHKYYQWVCFALFFQAMFFYFPRYLWKRWEGGRLAAILQQLRCPISNEKCTEITLLTTYLRNNLKYHDSYMYSFAFCELLNFINVILQVYFVDVFLGGAFTQYGLDVLKYTEMDQKDRVDPMVKIFPKMTKCTFHFYGSSGDVQKFDSLCILPLNIINEKIYIFIWFWFFLLTLISGLGLVYRAACLFSPKIRFYILRSRARLVDRYQVGLVVSRINVGDWFILYQLCKNMDPVNYKDLMFEFSKQLKTCDLGGRALIENKNGTGKKLDIERNCSPSSSNE